jgi:outer membrane protein insertion porin family
MNEQTGGVSLFPRSRRRKIFSLVTTLALLMSLVHPLLLDARQEVIGRPIREIEFIGLLSYQEEGMLFHLGLEVGKPYDPITLNENIKQLWARDFLDDISVEVEPADGGVKLVLHVEERPTLLSIDYEGLKKVNRGEILDAIDRERIDVYENGPLDLGELARLKGAIEQLYEDKGFRFAQVTLQIEEVSASDRRVLVTVDEGSKVKIGQIVFDGNEVFSQGKLRRAMKKTKKSNIVTRIRKRDVYNPATVQEDLELVRDLYRQQGYKNVVIGEPEVAIKTNKRGEVPSSGKRRLTISIPIEEGERWKLGDIIIEGNEVISDDVLRRAFAQPKGGWLRSDVIEKGIEQIQEFYNNTGYLFSQIKQETRERESLIADLIVTIDENDQFRVGRIEFFGNTRTKDKVLRRELRLHEGMVFNSGALRSSLFRINQLEYFRLNEEDPVEMDIDSENNKVNLTVKGDEAERNEIQFGGGYSEVDGFFAQASVRTRNFLGRGETLGIAIQTGRFRELFDISYFVPWVLDRPNSAGVQIFKRDLNFDLLVDQQVVRKEQGMILSYARSLGLFSGLNFSYNNSDIEDFRRQTFFNPDPDSDDVVLEQDFSFNKSAITVGFTHDSRDSRLEPTVGRRLRASVEYGGGFLGGDDWIVRPLLGGSIFKPLTRKGLRTVGAINAEVGWVRPFGEEDDGTPRELFFLDRFFLGGENSIRGFGFRSIWVRDKETGQTITDENGFPLGGDKFVQLNLEYHFVLDGPFRLVLFADAGNVYSEDQSIDPSHLRTSAGIEMRINVPLFGAPLRFIYSRNLDPLDNLRPGDEERFESFDFSIGTSF